MTQLEAVTVSEAEIVAIFNKKFTKTKLETLEELIEKAAGRAELEYSIHLLHYKDA
jgi:hypothetical protein